MIDAIIYTIELKNPKGNAKIIRNFPIEPPPDVIKPKKIVDIPPNIINIPDINFFHQQTIPQLDLIP